MDEAPPPPEIHRYGLSRVDSLPDNKRPSAYIIFVHGLFGHPFRTWTSKSTSITKTDHQLQDAAHSLETGEIFWPRDLLPRVVPDARIYTWGYNADIDHLFTAASQNTLLHHARNLVCDVVDEIEAESTLKPKASRFIIFITHSLGGLVVKDALNLSSRVEGTRKDKVALATFGVLFLGTPHRGSSSASIGKLAYTATRALTRRPNTKLLRALEKNSETLERIGHEFVTNIRKHSFSICSFREEFETRKYLFFHQLVVDPDSAQIGHESEEFNSIPADHGHMSKFYGLNDVGFRRIKAQIRRWVVNISGGSDTRSSSDCLQSLNDPAARHRISNIQKEYRSTFQWLYDPEKVTFTQWLRREPEFKQPIFWIRGKPGSGKSTLMKMALQSKETDRHLGLARHPSTNGSAGRASPVKNEETLTVPWTKISFFFHDRGSHIQKSLSGMLQDLLYQVLEQEKWFLRDIFDIYEKLSIDQRTPHPTWDLESLHEAWISLMKQDTTDLRLLVFLDALDEHVSNMGESNERLLSFITDLSSISSDRTTIIFCLASRPWPEFTRTLGNYPGFIIQDYTKPDIESYTRGRLSSVSPSGSPERESLVAKITVKASGVFIWVRLVVDEIAKAISDGTPLAQIKVILQSIPEELTELYKRSIRKLPHAYHSESDSLFQLVAHFPEPQTLETTYQCVHFLTYGSHSERFIYPGGMDSYLASRSASLLEIIQPFEDITDLGTGYSVSLDSSDTPNSYWVVQFIHRTVKDFMLDADTEAIFQCKKCSATQMTAHMSLLRCATWGSVHDSMEPLRQHFLKFAQEASRTCPNRLLPRLETCISESFDFFINDTRGQGWLSKWFSDNAVFEAIPSLGQDRTFRIMRAFPQLLLCFLAVTGGFRYMATPSTATTDLATERALREGSLGQLNDGSSINTRSFFLNVAISSTIRVQGHHSVEPLEALELSLDVERCRFATPDILNSESILVFAKPTSPYQRIALLTATPLTTLFVARFLTTATDGERLKAASYLLSRGADPNSRILLCPDYLSEEETQYSQTCLHYCARYESQDMVRLLLRHGAEPDSKDTWNMTPLMYAAMRRDPEIIEVFSEFGFRCELNLPLDSSSDDFSALWPWLMIPTGIGAAPYSGFVFQNRQTKPDQPDLSRLSDKIIRWSHANRTSKVMPRHGPNTVRTARAESY